jgi:hypothetical protein
MFVKILFYGLVSLLFKQEPLIPKDLKRSVIFIFYYMFGKKSESFVLLPKGSWKDTCKVTKFSHPYIWADCLDDKGRINKTFINTNTCHEFKHRDPDFKDPIHKQLHRTTYNLPHEHCDSSLEESNLLLIKNLSDFLLNEHKLINHDGNLDCEL